MDITYIPMARGFVYLAVVLDRFSRRVLALAGVDRHGGGFLSRSRRGGDARHGKPDIFNTDQGSQFTSAAFTGMLTDNGIAISMDGKEPGATTSSSNGSGGRSKYEEVYLRAYDSVGQARASLGRYLDFYNAGGRTEP